jgi:glycosyltransferase involved in cell wall biosynthesis
LLQVASLSRVKDQARLIDALAILAESLDVHLDLVGEDTVGGALQARASALGVRDRITFHGFVPHDEIAAIRGRAHLYVQTSRHESAGVAVLEAAAAGLPVIGTPVGYVADWAPERAVAFEGKSVKSVATAIAVLLKDADRRRRVASAALDFACSHDADHTAEEIAKIYNALHIPHDG